MEKNILVIDDDPDKRILEELRNDLEEEVNYESDITYTVNLDVVNPIPFLKLTGFNEDYSELFSHLQEQFLGKKLDMLLCDFNMHVSHKYLAFHIIDFVRQKNKACTIILFTGSPLKELTRINYNDLAKKVFDYVEGEEKLELNKLEKRLDKYRKEEELSEDLMQIAVKSGISCIIDRPAFDQMALEQIKKPSLILRIEEELLRNGELLFSDGNAKLNGMKLKEVAKHIREQTEEGIYFTDEIIRISLSNLIAFNS